MRFGKCRMGGTIPSWFQPATHPAEVRLDPWTGDTDSPVPPAAATRCLTVAGSSGGVRVFSWNVVRRVGRAPQGVGEDTDGTASGSNVFHLPGRNPVVD